MVAIKKGLNLETSDKEKLPPANQRIRALIDKFADRRVSKFAELLGFSASQSLNRLFNIDKRTGKYPVPSADIITKITEIFPSVSTSWLLHGKGDMMIVDRKADINDGDLPDDLYRTDFNVTKTVSKDKPNMWVVPVKLQAGFVKNFEKRTFSHEIEKVSWPFVQGECFSFEVEGKSMIPYYKPGIWVVCTLLLDWDELIEGEIYAFQTFEGLYIKQFVKMEADKVVIQSINPDSDPVHPIHLSDLRMIYDITGTYKPKKKVIKKSK